MLILVVVISAKNFSSISFSKFEFLTLFVGLWGFPVDTVFDVSNDVAKATGDGVGAGDMFGRLVIPERAEEAK